MWLIILVGWLWFPIWILTHCNKPYQISYIYVYIYMSVCVCSQLLRSKALKPIPGWTSWTPIYSTSILNGSWLSRFPHHPSGLQQTEGAFDGLGQSATDVKKSGKIPLFIIMGPTKSCKFVGPSWHHSWIVNGPWIRRRKQDDREVPIPNTV